MPLLDPGDGLTFRFPAIRLGMALWWTPVSLVIPRFNLNFLPPTVRNMQFHFFGVGAVLGF